MTTQCLCRFVFLLKQKSKYGVAQTECMPSQYRGCVDLTGIPFNLHIATASTVPAQYPENSNQAVRETSITAIPSKPSNPMNGVALITPATRGSRAGRQSFHLVIDQGSTRAFQSRIFRPGWNLGFHAVVFVWVAIDKVIATFNGKASRLKLLCFLAIKTRIALPVVRGWRPIVQKGPVQFIHKLVQIAFRHVVSRNTTIDTDSSTRMIHRWAVR